MKYLWKIFWIVYSLGFAVTDLLNLVNSRGNQYIMAIMFVLMFALAVFWIVRLVIELYK